MFIFLIALPILIIDQLSKYIVLKNFRPEQSLPIIKGIFHISLVCNKGIAFGLFSGKDPSLIWIFYLCVIIIVFVFIFYKKFFPKRKFSRIFLSLILAGAVGNLIDRIRFGCVVDFLDFRIWPVFNVADSAITIGTVLLILQMFKQRTSYKL